MKKVACLILCLMMIFALALPVLATEFDGVAAVPDGWEADGEQVITYGTTLPPTAVEASASTPAWIILVLLILVVVLLGGGLIAVVAVLVILLIVKAVRKKKTDTPEAQIEFFETE